MEGKEWQRQDRPKICQSEITLSLVLNFWSKGGEGRPEDLALKATIGLLRLITASSRCALHRTRVA